MFSKFIISKESKVILEETSAHVSINISTKRRPHPSIVNLPGPRTTSMYVMMKSLSSRNLDLWFEDGSAEMDYQGPLRPGEITSTNAKEGDKFVLTESGQRVQLMRFVLRKDQVRDCVLACPPIPTRTPPILTRCHDRCCTYFETMKTIPSQERRLTSQPSTSSFFRITSCELALGGGPTLIRMVPARPPCCTCGQPRRWAKRTEWCHTMATGG